ncbi:rhomboid family intramembrane serine protease [Nocardioides massiliensis]|uniref:Membrane associated rhomboid family serine protease n=1 Tax=Nocardioides massiliensis TaxID=1325935 RepID=A0ABT9NPB8_9ACTN|nr:rhomboid family intramembrane serine protease [Nocardioides massiliensis]MDP9822277.1 membrane associated rhomboid family serine protease [Nocardioides massiliensis]
MALAQRVRDGAPRWRSAAVVVVAFVALLWGIEVVDTVVGGRLDNGGVRPRSEDGAIGILLAPLLHVGWGHLIANTGPVLVLGFLVLAADLTRGIAVTLVIWLVGGAGTWLIAPDYTIHLGASTLIFGWLVYLILRGVFSLRIGEILLGVVLLVAYGGVLWGVLPGQTGVSWQSHLFGAVGGALAAWWFRGRERANQNAF